MRTHTKGYFESSARLHLTFVRRAQLASLPYRSKIQRTINVLKRIALDQYQICQQSFPDSTSVAEVESFGWKSSRGVQRFSRCEATLLDKDGEFLMHREAPRRADCG